MLLDWLVGWLVGWLDGVLVLIGWFLGLGFVGVSVSKYIMYAPPVMACCMCGAEAWLGYTTAKEAFGQAYLYMLNICFSGLCIGEPPGIYIYFLIILLAI